MLKVRWMVLVLLLLLSGCASQNGLPMEGAEEGVHYYFPKVSLSMNENFAERCEWSENRKWYKKTLLLDMKKSSYFLDVSEEKQPYHLAVTYTQYTYTSWGSKVVSWVTPAALFGGLDLDIEYELLIRITHHGKEIEKYLYKEDYVSKACSVHKEGKRFFEKSINAFLKTLPYKSKMKKIRVKSED
jgi:uncharacterized protein YceK